MPGPAASRSVADASESKDHKSAPPGRTVLLTGASKGIGAATAAALGRAGYHLVAHYGSDRAGAEAATAELPADRLLLVGADLACPARSTGYGVKRWPGAAKSMFWSTTPR